MPSSAALRSRIKSFTHWRRKLPRSLPKWRSAYYLSGCDDRSLSILKPASQSSPARRLISSFSARSRALQRRTYWRKSFSSPSPSRASGTTGNDENTSGRRNGGGVTLAAGAPVEEGAAGSVYACPVAYGDGGGKNDCWGAYWGIKRPLRAFTSANASWLLSPPPLLTLMMFPLPTPPLPGFDTLA